MSKDKPTDVATKGTGTSAKTATKAVEAKTEVTKTEGEVQATETAEVAKTVIRPDTDTYVNGISASGAKTQHNGDAVATALNGASVDEVATIAGTLLKADPAELKAKYAHLNVGQQRMNLGNRIRGIFNKLEKAEEGTGVTALSAASADVRKIVDKRVADQAEAKELAAVERQDKLDKAAKIKAEKIETAKVKAEADAKAKAEKADAKTDAKSGEKAKAA